MLLLQEWCRGLLIMFLWDFLPANAFSGSNTNLLLPECFSHGRGPL